MEQLCFRLLECLSVNHKLSAVLQVRLDTRGPSFDCGGEGGDLNEFCESGAADSFPIVDFLLWFSFNFNFTFFFSIMNKSSSKLKNVSLTLFLFFSER